MNKETILILGASSDIGCELISRLPRNYGHVVAHGNTSTGRLRTLASQRPDLAFEVVQADLSNRRETEMQLADLAARGIAPTRLVHLPAPPFAYRRLRELTWDVVQQEIDVQTRSLFLLFKAFLPGMMERQRGKVVVLLSSVLADPPPRYLMHYIAAKECLWGLVRSAAADVEGKEITINAVSPGMIKTRFISDLPEAFQQAEATRMPGHRLLEPPEVASAILHLLSEASGTASGKQWSVPLEASAHDL